MELNWSTFVLEIINFLVLVWILQRLLYKPVLAVIARRRAGIEKTLADAKHLQAEAERLKAQYESRLAGLGTGTAKGA
jgi:F-type H+-transporting ATPase subunit b